MSSWPAGEASCDSEYIVDLHVETDLVDREVSWNYRCCWSSVAWELRKVTDHEVSQVWWWSQNVSPSIHISGPSREFWRTVPDHWTQMLFPSWLTLYMNLWPLFAEFVWSKSTDSSATNSELTGLIKLYENNCSVTEPSSTSLSERQKRFQLRCRCIRFGLLPWWWKFHCSWCGRARNNYGAVSNNPVSIHSRGEVNSPSVRPRNLNDAVDIDRRFYLSDRLSWNLSPSPLRCFEWRELAQCSQCFGKCVVLVRDLDDRSFGVVMRLISKMIEPESPDFLIAALQVRGGMQHSRRWYRFQLSS